MAMWNGPSGKVHIISPFREIKIFLGQKENKKNINTEYKIRPHPYKMLWLVLAI